ncbi:MAG TPA: hypothetical protein VK856_01535 [Anaerolineaceae bacterium]|nr:hypothetical protein [Anaerolineaceae bacterium]
MKKKRILKTPIIFVFLGLIILFLSPFILSWITKTMVSMIDGFQVRVQWMNQSEVIGGHPHLQFYLSQEVANDDLNKSFYIQPETEGTWQWLEDDLVIWTPDGYLEPGQMIHFGFNQEKSSDENIKSIQWQAFIRHPKIVYLKSVEGGKELFKVPSDATVPVRQITNTDGIVEDFTISPDGEQILAVLGNEQSGIDLWLMDRDGENLKLLLDCGLDRCANPSWNPVRDEIVFTIEKHRFVNDQPGWDLPNVYLLNLVSGITQPLATDENAIGFDPVWSSKGQWVTIWKGVDQGIEILHASTGQPVYRDAGSDDTGCWSPDERYFYYSNVREEGMPIVSIIYQLEILSTQRTFFTGSELVNLGNNYYYPICHPEGEGVATVVQVDPLIPQRELWWIKVDSTYQKIFDDLSLMVTQFRWSPDGSKAIFLQDTLMGLADGSRIGLWDAGAPDEKQVFEDQVFKLEWLP